MALASIRWELPWFAFLALSVACSSNDDGGAGGSAASGTTGGGAASTLGAGGNKSLDTTSTSATSASATSASATSTSATDAGGSSGGLPTSAASAGGTTGTTNANGGATTDTGTDTASGGNQTSAAGAGNDTGPIEPGPLTLYYLNVTQDRVMSVSDEGGQPELLAEGTGQGPDGIAVDAQGQHLYWTNMGVPAENDGFILRSDLDGSNVTTIVEPGQTYTPKQIKVDADTGKLYWGDREGMRVMRCNLDGSELETLVTIAQGEQARADRANHAVGVSVDDADGYVYWIQKGPPNGGEGSIRRASLVMPEGETSVTRTDIEVLYAGLPEPIDLDVDVEGGMMYWTDRGDATINRAPVAIPAGATAATRDDREILVEGVDVAIGIWLDLQEGHVYYTGTDVVGRANLDGSSNTTLVPNAGVLTGITGLRLP